MYSIINSTVRYSVAVTQILSIVVSLEIFLIFFYQELLYIWNGFKVLNRRPDLVLPLMKLVESSLHKVRQTKGKRIG